MRLSQPSLTRFCLSLAVAFVSATSMADDTTSSVVIREYAAGDSSCFAMAVRGDGLAEQQVSRFAVVVDTSASQVGTVRETSLALVNQVLSQLPTNSTAQLFAVDVECEALTDQAVAVNSDAMRQALNDLALRTPLGTTNLRSALQTLSKSADAQRPMSVLYIGDGLASSELIAPADLQQLTNLFTRGGVFVHSAVIGPKANAEFPGVLANLTGGTVVKLQSGRADLVAPHVVQALQTAPSRIKSLEADGQPIELVTQQTLFLRSDRHSVLMGRGNVPQFRSLKVQTDSRDIRFGASDCERVAAGIPLTQLVGRCIRSNGLDVSVAGLDMLHAYCHRVATQIDQYKRAEKLLVRRGDHLKASKVRIMLTAMQEAAEELAPPPPEDVQLGGAVPNPVDPVAPQLPEELGEAVQSGALGNQPPVPGESPVTPSFAADGFGAPPAAAVDVLQEVANQVKRQTGILKANTDQALDQARRLSFDNPDAAETRLKDILETIQTSSDISPEVRSELQQRVAGALDDVRNRRGANELKERQLAQSQAVTETNKRQIADELFEENRLGTLIDQVRGLLTQGRKGDSNAYEDAEAVSRDALNLRPGNGPATQALVMSESNGQLDKAYRLVNLRNDRFLETLYQVELSHVPFPDEPPIQYPPADVWRALTLTRKPRYESFDLREEKPVEKWLRQLLDEPVPLLDYPGDTPLSEILDQLSSHFNLTFGELEGKPLRMTVWPDLAELEIDGITSLEDVTVRDITFEGITLRNALDLIFERTTDPELTYIIDNEVFNVTTLAKAESDENLVTRVYPVADLVIPPIQLGGGGGGGGLGGGGQGGLGGGQGGGGFGGGGGGFGGGGQGGGGFGGGGGAFSVPPEIFDVLQDADNGITNENVKKK